jgi:hypothetical protein
MTVVYHLRGYDKTTEFVSVEFDIPAAMLPLVKALLPDIDADPDLVEPHAIACDQVARLAHELRVSVNPDSFDFYIEADEDWRTAGKRHDPVRAKA